MTRVSTGQALRDAMAAARPVHMAQDALVEEEASRVHLEALAHRLATTHAAWQIAGAPPLIEPLNPEDLARAASIVRTAARYGLPRPAVQRLADEAATIPGARASDPVTSHLADAEARLVPKVGNQMGRLLMAYAVAHYAAAKELNETGEEFVDAPGMTSEEAARRAGLDPRSEYAKRCSVLMRLGYLRVAIDDDGHERTRRGKAGRQRLVLELTQRGHDTARQLLADVGAPA